MAVATYPESKVIEQIHFRQTEKGTPRAYVHAKEGTSPEQLNEVVAYMRGQGWITNPASFKDKPVLEVHGFANGGKLVSDLQGKGWITGKGSVKEDIVGDEKGFRDKYLKKHSLLGASLLYVLGDIKFFTYGLKEANKLDMAAGAAYGAGTAVNFAFGETPITGRRDRSDLEINDLSKRMADYMNAQKIEIPKEASLHHLVNEKKKGTLKSLDDLARHYPAEMMHAFFAMAGVCIAVAASRKIGAAATTEAVEQFMQHNPENSLLESRAVVEKWNDISHYLDIGLGTITFSSGMFGALVKEKKPDPDNPKRSGIAGAWDKLQEKPLAVSGIGLMVATMCHAVSTSIAYKLGDPKTRNAVVDRGLFVGTNLMAEALIAISSKGHGHGVKADLSVDETIMDLAAETIVKEPVETRQRIIDDLSACLGRPDMLGMKNAEVKEQLIHRVEAVAKNPWALATSSCADGKCDQDKVTLASKSADKDWKGKVAHATTEQASPDSPQLSV